MEEKNKHSLGVCDLCGEHVDYDDNWYDLGLVEPSENEWLERSLFLWGKAFGKNPSDITDVCPVCFHRLTTEDGFRSLPLADYSGITTRGGKSHEDETMGEFLDEVGIKADADEMEISYALLTSGLYPLKVSHYPFFLTELTKQRDFIKFSKKDFLDIHPQVSETEYDMTKKFWGNYHE